MANTHKQTATQIIGVMELKRKSNKTYIHVNTGFFAELGYDDSTATFFLQYTGILTIDCSSILMADLVRATLVYLGIAYDEDNSTNTVFKIK